MALGEEEGLRLVEEDNGPSLARASVVVPQETAAAVSEVQREWHSVVVVAFEIYDASANISAGVEVLHKIASESIATSIDIGIGMGESG